MNTASLVDAAAMLDLSIIKHANKIWEKAHGMMLYSIAVYDAGLFIYPFYILQKK